MIRLTKFDGSSVIINAEWIQSIETTPDTVITLTNGFVFLVKERAEEVVTAFRKYKRDMFTNLKLEERT